MRKLSKPTIRARTAFDVCAASHGDEYGSEYWLEVLAAMVEGESERYDSLAPQAELHAVDPSACVHPDMCAYALGLYKTMVRKRPPRDIYDQLRAAPDARVCPLCGQRSTTTLDHYLPKSKFPLLAVAPLNLIPACSDCNGLKRALAPQDNTQLFFHPYYDDWSTDRWLYGKVIADGPPAVAFYANPPTDWKPEQAKRLVFHVTKLGLSELYAIQAAEELSSIRGTLLRMPRASVRGHLRDCARSRQEVHLNSWRSAMYDALATDDWFCLRGFELIDGPARG